jgi:hypothetical protein
MKKILKQKVAKQQNLSQSGHTAANPKVEDPAQVLSY